METLKTGGLAYFDCFAGLVPVRVLSVTAPAEKPLFDLGHGGARASIKVGFCVTADHGAYKKGEKLDSNSLSVVPRRAVQTHQFSRSILAYQVQPDAVAH